MGLSLADLAQRSGIVVSAKLLLHIHTSFNIIYIMRTFIIKAA